MGFSCTESTRGTVEGLLRYAAHLQKHSVHENPLFLHGRRFQRNSVLKIGFYGTGEIFGTGNGLLGYGMDIRVVREAAKRPPGHKSTTGPQNDHQSTPQGHKRGGHNI